jgi:hypothetical protein
MPMPSGIPAGTAPAQQRPTHRDAAAQPARPPVTSMSPDPNRIPIPRPQQEPEKPKKGGVEF